MLIDTLKSLCLSLKRVAKMPFLFKRRRKEANRIWNAIPINNWISASEIAKKTDSTVDRVTCILNALRSLGFIKSKRAYPYNPIHKCKMRKTLYKKIKNSTFDLVLSKAKPKFVIEI